MPTSAHAQRALDLQAGRWAVPGSDPTFFSVALWRRLIGPAGYGIRGLGLVDGDSAGRSLYGLGLELTLIRGTETLAPYAVAGAGVALESGDSTGATALWSAGGGLEWVPLPWLSLAGEVRRFAEDRTLAGFWDLKPGDRRGWLFSSRVSFHWGGRSSATASTVRPASPPDWLRIEAAAGPPEPLSEDARRQATWVVETAVRVMGEPYRWGGTRSEEGFDCSGLIWYAYRTHGVSVPRVSRDQARMGRYITPEVGRLEPGDILLFTVRPNAVTHVGLYVGNGKFIHATRTGGVVIGALEPASNGNDRWWLQRWVGARRVLR